MSQPFHSQIYTQEKCIYLCIKKHVKEIFLAPLFVRTKCKWKQTYINIQIHKCNIYIKGNTTEQ